MAVLLAPVLAPRALPATPAAASPLPQTAPPPAGVTAVYFPETGHHLQLGFLEHWRRNGGPSRLGLPVTEELFDAGVAAPPGAAPGGMAQHFQLGRLEWRAGPPGTPGETREVLEPFDAARAAARGISTTAVPRTPGTADWTVALAPPAPALTTSPGSARPGYAFVVAVASDDPAAPLTATGSIAPQGAPEGEKPLRLFPAGAGRLLAVASVDLDESPRPWTITATVRNALGLESPPQSIPFQIVDGNFPLQRLNIQANLVPLLEPQVRLRENLTLAALTAETQPQPLWRGRFLQPVSGTLVTVHGARRTYVDPAGRDAGAAQHTGVDLGATFGTPILATADGIVAFTGAWSIKGNVVVVDHGAGVHSVYGHASSFAVAAGDRVTRGQTIAYIGSTGLSTGPHLHWEMRVGGIAVEPLEWAQRADLPLP